MMPDVWMTNLGILYYFLGLEVCQGEHGILISQKKYMYDMLEKLNMLNCNTASTPPNTCTNCVLTTGH